MTREQWDAALMERFDAGQSKISAASGLSERQATIHATCFREVLSQLGGVFGEREMLLGTQGYATDPAFVVTGDAALLTAMARLYPTGDYGPRLVPMLDADYESFVAEHKEPKEFLWHSRWWSRFSAPGPAPAGAESFVDGAVGPFCVHDLGILWGPHHGFETSSLWRIQADELVLVAQDFSGKRF